MNFLKRLHWFEWALIVVVMGVHLYAAFSAPHNFSMRWFVRDDAYYYFKVAQNISEGHGSTFDGINPTNGYHPLWTLVCVPIFALARFDLILPLRVLLVVMAALSVIASLLLFRLLKKTVGEPIAMLAAAYWGLDMNIHAIVTQQGLETGLVAVSVLLFLRLMQQLDEKESLTNGDFIRLALAALFVLFSRLDGIYLALIAGVWMVFRRTSMRYLVPLDLILVFGTIVGAYLQRAGLKFYMLSFTDSAMIMSAVTFVVQAVIFYLLGLYEHPKTQSIREIFVRALLGVTLTAGLSAGVMLSLNALGLAQMPRAVPLLYWGAMFIFTLAVRLALRVISLHQEQVSLERGFAFSSLFWFFSSQFRLLSKWLHAGLPYYGTFAAGLLAYLGINHWLFGTFMPVSGQIKRWWGSLPGNAYGGGNKTILDVYTLDPLHSQSWGVLTSPLYTWAQTFTSNPEAWYWSAFVLIILVWLFVMLRNPSRTLPRLIQTGFIPLFLSAWLHGFLYSAMGYAASHEWYWTTEMLSLVLAGALGLRGLLDILPPHRTLIAATWASAGALSLLLAWTFSITIIRRMPYVSPYAGQPYLDMLTILEGYTEEGAVIGMTGGGSAGYFIRNRTIVNMDGLINSYPYFQSLKTGQAARYLADIGLDYVFANAYIITHSAPYDQQFRLEQFIPVPGAPKYGQKELLKFQPLPEQ
ncbi:MAG: hypothetical protein N2117_04795 [Anaerolineales bacterium]|nr:hypothetical protein [Anaerolineales bacterium]